MPSNTNQSRSYLTPPHLTSSHERHSSEYSEESTILTTSGDSHQQQHLRNNSQPPSSFSATSLASRSKSNPPVSMSATKIYGGGMPIPFGVLDNYTPPPLKSSNSSSSVQTKSSAIPTSPSTTGKNKKEEIQTNTSEWCTLTTQNHDSLFPLEGHQIFYWEQCLEDEDDLTSSVETTSIFNRSLNMIVLFGGTGPIRGNTNQIYCMVPKHSGINSSPATNVSNPQNCKYQWVPVPSHYIPNYLPPSLTSASSNDIDKLERKSSKTNILNNSNPGSSSPRRSSFELSSIAEDGSTEIPLFKSRYDHSMVLCGNNKAYLFGGRNGMFSKTPIQDFILYSLDMDISNQFTWEMAHIPPKNERDPSTLKQSQRGLDDLYNRESPLPRYNHSCCAVNQKQSVLQRSNSTAAGSSQNMELNSESDTLSDLSIGGLNNNFESNSSSASTGSTRFNNDGGVVLDCAMLLFGGVAFVDYSGSKKCKETNDFWMFNCKERKWLSYPSIIQRYFKNSSSILQFKTDDKYMQEISLSSTASGSSSSNYEGRKHPKKPANTNIISIHSSFVPEARYGHQMCVVSNSLVFVIGGATLNKDAMYKDVWTLSLGTFEWRKVNLLHNKNNEQFINKIPIRYASHVVVGRRILIYGGQLSYKTGDYLTELLCFDTETYRFSIIENSISPKFDSGLVKATMILYGIDLLIVGGKRGVSSYRYNDSVQSFSLKLHSISKTNQRLLRENTKLKKSNQMLAPGELTYEIPTFGDDEDDEFDAANSVKIDLLSQILLSEMSSSDFSRKEALKYLAEVKQIDIVKQLFRNNSIHRALSIIMQSGSKSDIRQTAKVLFRYFKDTDQGTLPFIIARQVLKFIESYLTLINTLIRLREPISQTLHLDYLGLFHMMCQNFEYYESLSKELISVFQQCYKLSDPLSKASLDILQLSISSIEFLSLNAMHFASKCDKETCIIFRDFILLCNEAKSKTAKNLEDNPIGLQASILKLDDLVTKLCKSLSRLSSRSKPIKKYLGKLLRRNEEEEDI